MYILCFVLFCFFLWDRIGFVGKRHLLFRRGVFFLFMGILCCGCKKNKMESAGASINGKEMPSVRTWDVEAKISEDGKVQYKIIAKEWQRFSFSDNPYAYFPQGFYLETYDSLFQIESDVRADTLYYYEQEEICKFIGHVEIHNKEKDTITTNLLFWNRRKDRIYTDSFIRIKGPERLIEGYGFESNGSMTDYVLLNSGGDFPVEDEESAPNQEDSTKTIDTLKVP
ncbi:MAG TPA: LPS export ABC transporter periplasmic protein LptC [Porphyromonadaceae bacterium]|nr:LPS export ABC transporter periplasmic protein LptC [Porphyromonadaceae bacterium]